MTRATTAAFSRRCALGFSRCALGVALGVLTVGLALGVVSTGEARAQAGSYEAQAVRDFSRRMTYEELRKRELEATLERVRAETEVERARTERTKARQALRALGVPAPAPVAAADDDTPRPVAKAPPPSDVHLVWRRGNKALLVLTAPDGATREVIVHPGATLPNHGRVAMTPDGGITLNNRRVDLYLREVRLSPPDATR